MIKILIHCCICLLLFASMPPLLAATSKQSFTVDCVQPNRLNIQNCTASNPDNIFVRHGCSAYGNNCKLETTYTETATYTCPGTVTSFCIASCKDNKFTESQNYECIDACQNEFHKANNCRISTSLNLLLPPSNL